MFLGVEGYRIGEREKLSNDTIYINKTL